MLKLIDIDAEEYYNNAIQAMEIAAGEPLYPGDERRVFTEALVAVLVGIANKCNEACNGRIRGCRGIGFVGIIWRRGRVKEIPRQNRS